MDSYGNYDTNNWTPGFVSANRAECVRILRAIISVVETLVREKNYPDAISGLEKICVGLIAMDDAKLGDFNRQIVLLAFLMPAVTILGMLDMDSPESYRREAALQTAREMARTSNPKIAANYKITKDLVDSFIIDLSSGVPTEQIKRKSNFPADVFDSLRSLDQDLSALSPSSSAYTPPPERENFSQENSGFQEGKSVFCVKCGARCPEGARFCEQCGSSLLPPASPPVSRPAAPAQRKSGGAIAAVLIVLLLLAAAGGLFLFRTRAANEADLKENLAQYMWDYCLPDIEDYYDDVLPKRFSDNGYTIGRKGSSFRIQPAKKTDTYTVSGKFDVTDKTRDDVRCRVNVEGTVTTDFMRSQYTWNLNYDFEDPPGVSGKPAAQPDDGYAGDDSAPDSAGWWDMPTDPPEYYIWPTDTQYITYNDLYAYSRYEVMLMRNELYARYGCYFLDDEIRSYFLDQSWYTPDVDSLAVDFNIERFTDIERANLETILSYEKDMGWRK